MLGFQVERRRCPNIANTDGPSHDFCAAATYMAANDGNVAGVCSVNTSGVVTYNTAAGARSPSRAQLALLVAFHFLRSPPITTHGRGPLALLNLATAAQS